MLSIDTNILLYAQNSDCPEYPRAVAFFTDCTTRSDVVLCEPVLVELYILLRNPAVVMCPLVAKAAAVICQPYWSDPRWRLIENAPVMEQVWK